MRKVWFFWMMDGCRKLGSRWYRGSRWQYAEKNRDRSYNEKGGDSSLRQITQGGRGATSQGSGDDSIVYLWLGFFTIVVTAFCPPGN